MGFFDNLKKEFFGGSIDPALKRQLEKRGQTEKLKELQKAQSKSSLINTIPQTGLEFGGKAISFLADIPRAVPRQVISAALEPTAGILELATGRKIGPVFQPKGKIEQFFLGTEPIKGIFKRQEDTQKITESILKRVGVKDKTATPTSFILAPLLVGAMTGLDLAPVGGGSKRVGEQISKDLIAKYGDDVARQIIKREIGRASCRERV